jgi:hypothetical protein
MRGPGEDGAKVTSVEAENAPAKDGKRPTPFVMTVVATGANHAAFYRSKVKAQIAFNGLASARAAFIEARKSDPGHQADYVFDDDAGTRYIVSLGEFRSAQLADIVGEHWANADRKITEAYIAVDFQQHVTKHHAGLTLLRAAPGSSIVQPGRN